MDLTDENLQTLSSYLVKTLSPNIDERKPAEEFLESIELNRNYPGLLLTLINKEEVHPTIRVAGAIIFKNYIKRNWFIVSEEQNKIHPDDRDAIKLTIVEVMLKSPSNIQKQIGEAIGIIGKHDFPDKWKSLTIEMVQKFASGDFNIINGILQTAHSIFKRYRFEFKSQELWTEIKYVLDTFAKPLTDLALATQNLTEAHANNPVALHVIYSSLLLIAKIFYSLNFQDIPEFFEDNMSTWMQLFHTNLMAEVNCLETDDENEAGVMIQLKSQICSNVSLYAQKYDEEFQQYLPGFVTDIWGLLVTVSLQPKNDMLVSNALQFLSTVAGRKQHWHLFEDKNVLTGICEKVVLPNIHFRDADLELFEDNPEEYIRRDIEGSDVESRRRSASDLVKVLSVNFPDTVKEIFGTCVQQMLSEYLNDSSKWRLKNAAVYIVISLADRGSTAKHGVTKASELVVLPDFANQYMIPELDKEVNALPVLKADSIKYLITFRSILPPQMMVASFPLIMKHLISPNKVVHSYAASAIDKLLLLRHNGPLVINERVLAPYAARLFKGLFNIFTMQGSEENEYAMKAIMRTCSVLNEYVIPYLSDVLPKLTEKLTAAAKNPSNPRFNHFLFETITISIRIVCRKNPQAVSAFEEALFPIFQIIFHQDVQEFIPYVMQVLSMTLSFRRAPLPAAYVALYPRILTPQLWERSGSVRGYVCLLLAYIKIASPQDFVDTIKVSGLLGIFQKLISSKLNDHEGFAIIQSLIEFCPRELLTNHILHVVLLLFQRLTVSKTVKFCKCLIVFLCLLVCKFGTLTFIEIVDTIQPQMFQMVVERVILPDCQKIVEKVNRKIVITGLSQLLAETRHVFGSTYSSIWSPLTKCVVELLEVYRDGDDDDDNDDNGFIEVENAPGYDAAYVHLSALGKDIHDPLPEVTDTRSMFALQLKNLYSSKGEAVTEAIGNLGNPYTEQIKVYLSRVGLNI